jgi:hypothetical protein
MRLPPDRLGGKLRTRSAGLETPGQDDARGNRALCIHKQAFARILGARRTPGATLHPQIIMPRMAPVLL